MSDAAAPDTRAVQTNGSASTPTQVARRFLERLAANDLEGAIDLVADDIVYTNVSLPSVKGRDNVRRVLAGLDRPNVAFEVYFHSISAEGGTVLTERTDVIQLGRVRVQFWVWGRFDVADGHITLWRDSFDWSDMARATLRGLLGAVIPSVQPKPPSDPITQSPGR